MTPRDWILIVALGALFGAVFPFNAVLLREIGPVSISFFRVALGALAVWLVVAVRRVPVALTRRQIGQAVVFGTFMFALPFTLFPLSQYRITGGMAGIVNAMTPIAVVIVSQAWPGGERVSWLKAAGVLLGFCGIILLSLPSLLSEDGGSEILGIAIALLAPISYAIGLNYIRRLGEIDIAVVVAAAMTGAAVLLVPGMLVVEGVPRLTAPLSYASLAALGPVLTGWVFLSALWLTRRVGATASSTITFVAPISALLIGASALGEEVRGVHLAGMAVIFAGLLAIDGRAFTRTGRG